MNTIYKTFYIYEIIDLLTKMKTISTARKDLIHTSISLTPTFSFFVDLSNFWKSVNFLVLVVFSQILGFFQKCKFIKINCFSYFTNYYFYIPTILNGYCSGIFERFNKSKPQLGIVVF